METVWTKSVRGKDEEFEKKKQTKNKNQVIKYLQMTTEFKEDEN